MSLAPDRLCVIVGRTRHKMVLAELQEAAKRGIKFIELRLDYLSKAVDFARLLPLKQGAWMATIRRREDGGKWNGSEADRMMIMRQAIVGGFDWVDLETDIADKVPRFREVKRLVSYHNMRETPTDLEGIFKAMLKQDADVYKIAVMANVPQDNVRILKLIEASPKPLIAHCMGEMGVPSRVLSLKCGSPFTYAAFNKERNIAPGLPSFEEMKRVFPTYEKVGKSSKVFGVVGDPVSHSFSPLLHNQMYHRMGIDAVYVPFRVPRGALPANLKEFNKIPVDGYSVTIPHKEAAASVATSIDQRVAETLAANTLVKQDGKMLAYNTDYDAAIESLLANMPMGENNVRRKLEGAIALILGAGGAARAMAHALHKQGAHVKVTSRTHAQATKLADEVQGKAVEWETRHNGDCEILVNCTPVGMHPNVDDSPVHHSFLKPDMVVFDTIYTPENTLLIKQAKARGSVAVTGVEMFVRQAAMQIKLFTGQDADLQTMREIMRKALSPAHYTAAATPEDGGEDDD